MPAPAPPSDAPPAAPPEPADPALPPAPAVPEEPPLPPPEVLDALPAAPAVPLPAAPEPPEVLEVTPEVLDDPPAVVDELPDELVLPVALAMLEVAVLVVPVAETLVSAAFPAPVVDSAQAINKTLVHQGATTKASFRMGRLRARSTAELTSPIISDSGDALRYSHTAFLQCYIWHILALGSCDEERQACA